MGLLSSREGVIFISANYYMYSTPTTNTKSTLYIV
jgi:hypothetical protein